MQKSKYTLHFSKYLTSPMAAPRKFSSSPQRLARRRTICRSERDKNCPGANVHTTCLAMHGHCKMKPFNSPHSKGKNKNKLFVPRAATCLLSHSYLQARRTCFANPLETGRSVWVKWQLSSKRVWCICSLSCCRTDKRLKEGKIGMYGPKIGYQEKPSTRNNEERKCHHLKWA